MGLLESFLKQLIVAKTNFLAGTDRDVPATDIVRHTEECSVVLVARQRIRTYLTVSIVLFVPLPDATKAQVLIVHNNETERRP